MYTIGIAKLAKHATTLSATIVAALLGTGVACAQPQSADQQRCINDLNKRGAKVHAASGKRAVSCVNDAAAGRLQSSFAECLAADTKSKVARARTATEDAAADRCADAPDFGPAAADAVNDGMEAAAAAVLGDAFGADPDSAVVSSAEERSTSRCQTTAFKQTLKCIDVQLAELNRCKKDGLRGRAAPAGAGLPFASSADLEACVGHDARGRIAKACDAKLGSKLAKRCAGADLGEALPGCESETTEQARQCLDAAARCRSCAALVAADRLAGLDCDALDDGAANASCATPATCGDGSPDAGEACDPPGSTAGCGEGELCSAACQCVPAGAGGGARSFKSGPIQITADGASVWLVNPDNDSVSHIDAAGGSVTEHVLPVLTGPHRPRGLSISEDGQSVWVACHDSDRVFVLDGTSGAITDEIALPWGSGPVAMALSRDQQVALVSLHRAAALAVLDVGSRSLDRILAPAHASPLGIVWTEGGDAAWITHLFADDEHPFISRVDFSGAEPKITTRMQAFASDPRSSFSLAPPFDVAEGGYLTFRGHAAQLPGSGSAGEIWLPTQYNNITEDGYSPDSTVQAVRRRLDLATRTLPNTNSDKVVFSALHVHDPAASGNPYVGPGWNAGVAGPIDIAFSADGSTAAMVFELSNDVVVFPTTLGAVRPGGAPDLIEIGVGKRPIGIAVSPVDGTAYVANRHSRDVSVIDLAAQVETARIAATPVTGEPFAAAFLRGAELFHTSDDDRISTGRKVACASCHLNAEHDGRSWSFQNLPGNHGPRATPSLLSLGLSFGPVDPATGFGQLHLSGDRDEVQDFEHTFRSVTMGGTGFLGAGIQPELGAPNGGRDTDLDAIADYVLGLTPLARSPHRGAGGTLDEAAVRGATFFVGTDTAGHVADSGCATCHVPETGFTDRGFHDVGQRRPQQEQELNHSSRAPYQWHVNTPSLVGAWMTPPYEGVSGFAIEMIDVVEDIATRTSHGTPGGLLGRQLADLEAFLLSIDGNTAAAEVRGAADVDPPRVVRVEPASADTVDVWLSEAVARASAESTANWTILENGSTPIAVTAAVRDDLNGDRVTLSAALTPGAPSPNTYTVVPGAILDLADAASGGTANGLDTADPNNTHTFDLGDTLTITLGASGYENLTVPVHDAGMVGAGLSTWGHDAAWLFPTGGSQNKGFVRFVWQASFSAVTGVSDANAIVDAAIVMEPVWGDSQTIEIRRCLLAWSDPASGGDWNSNPTGGPTWRDHAHPSSRWNQSGARRRTTGVDGDTIGDFDGANDLAFTPDASVTMAAINEPITFGGAAVTDAFRFWFDNPSVDYGYALELAAGATHETKLDGWDRRLHRHGPVLVLTYQLP